MINRDELRVWVAQARKCLQKTRCSPSYVESHLIGLRSLRSDPEANSLYERLLLHLDDAKRRWKRK